MLNRFCRIGSLAVVIVFSGYFASANAQSVSGSIGNGTVTPGKAARATVVLNIPAGLHANSNRPGSEYAIPTTVNATAKGVKIGSVSYPRGRNRKFSFSESTINVYEGRAAFGFDVTVPANYKGTTVKINATVRYQTCNSEVCYPPKSRQVTFTARVKPTVAQ
ncbi:MAG: protein-disulfide reductase DsbD domain-containing protein [Pyrinomonadaceae bacterium]